jgi:anaerobic selenocysteine-containing dehydrogenase
MSDNVLSRGLTRRQFLKTTAATAAVVAVGDKLFGGPVSALTARAAAPQAATEDVWVPSACYQCFSDCGILAHRVNGVVVKIEGNPNHPANQGRICARGNAGLMKMYNPYRFKNPMKRTNAEKGRGVDPKWQEITWDEALNTIADKLKKIKAEDPRKFMVMAGWGSREWGGRVDSHVGAGFGTPNAISGPGGMTCAAAFHDIGYLTNGTSSACGQDYNYVRYYLNIGSSIGLNKGDPEASREFWKAKERGMKFVTVDVRASPETSKADEWIAIRGGTDLAFELALANVILYEIKKYDVDFLKKRTNGPYLIRADTGLYMRSSTDIMKEDPSRKNQKLGKPYVWDPTDNKAKVFDDPSIKDYALEGTFTVDGIKCSPSFDLYRQAMKDYTPEWQEKISTVPAATVRRVAQEMVEAAQFGSTIVVDGVTFPFRPVAVNIGRGAQTHRWGTTIVEAAYLINLLLGSAETPGGNVSGGVTQEAGVDGTNLPKGTAVYRPFKYPPDYNMDSTYWPTSYKSYWATWDAILNPDKYGIKYSLDALFIVGANPIFGFGSPDMVTDALKKIPFIFALSYHSDEPTELADIVLPDPGYTEWLHMAKTALRQPLVDKPLYNTMTTEDAITEIAARSGWLDGWNKRINSNLRLKTAYQLSPTQKYTEAEILDRQMKSTYGDSRGLEWFKKNGVVNDPAPEKETYGYYFNPKTRYHLYFEYIKWAAEELKKDMAAAKATHPFPDWAQSFDPIPSWKPNPTFTAPAEFDLYESNYRTSLMSMGFSPDNPWTHEAMQFDPYPRSVWMNRQTATKKGLKDGDLVWVESYVQEKWSKVKGEVLTSEGVHPESVIIGGQWGRWAVNMNNIAKEGPHHNSLISIKLPFIDHFSGTIELSSKVKVYKV